MRYHGGKWVLAPWIINHFPPHKTYTEAFGGAASVLLRKPRCFAEIYNDLDEEVVNVFRVLRDPQQANHLYKLLALTPYSRTEFDQSFIASSDPVEQARRTLFRAAAGHSGRGATGGSTGFRVYSRQSRNTTPADDWRTIHTHIESFVERLRGVCIENRPAIDIIQRHDSKETLHYVDPPYVSITRDSGNDYRYEMTDDDHFQLAKIIKGCEGFVIVSGYRCNLYDDLFSGWVRIERPSFAEGAHKRIECLWLNPQASEQQLRMELEQ